MMPGVGPIDQRALAAFLNKNKPDDVASRRKPRQYMSQETAPAAEEYTLEFCLWLHEKFDDLLDEAR